MKRRVTVQLPEQLIERLEVAAQRSGASKTAIMATALDRFLDPRAQTTDDATVLRRLDWMTWKLDQLDRNLRIVNETVALHARYQLTVTPALPQSHQQAACALGLERFEAFAAQVGRRVHLGTPLMRETMDRVSTTSPQLFTRESEEGVPLGTPAPDPNQDLSVPPIMDAEPAPRAAAREGGSNVGFPGEAHNSTRSGRGGTPCPNTAPANTAMGGTLEA